MNHKVDLTKFVNIEVGTDSEYRESNGNTLPNVQWPFGNQAYVLQSNKKDRGWFYKPKASYCEGIRVTNQPSPWLGDYGQITILPFIRDYNVDLHSSFTEKRLKPYYMSGTFNRFESNFELSPTRNGAKMNVRNLSNQTSKLLLDFHSDQVSYEIKENNIYITSFNIGDTEYRSNFRKFYVVKLDSEILSSSEVINDSIAGMKSIQLILEIASKHYSISLSSSYISYKVASDNASQIASSNFDCLKRRANAEWNKYLSTVEVKQPNSTFYSNMYRLFCYPRIISENIEGNEYYYNFKTRTVDEGMMIADVGFWDTYRTTMPLYKVLIPTVYKQFISAIINYYKSYGWLPRWLAPYERGVMPSTLTDSVIASALISGDVESSCINDAIEALLKNGNIISENQLFGRMHLQQYISFGYVPKEVTYKSVSLSLDNYYCDYAIYKVLLKYEHPQAMEYYKRCMNYKKLFNKETGYFQSLDKQQQFEQNFEPNEWGFNFCESSAYQNNFNVFHDVDNFIEIFGGAEEIEKRLNYLFNNKPNYQIGKHKTEIHEMTEYAKIRDLGHFAISNQPSFNMPFWYLHINKPNEFDRVIKKSLKYFTSSIDGYPGDEDNGSLSAWYILVNIGMYPFCPVDGFIKFTPQLDYKLNPI